MKVLLTLILVFLVFLLAGVLFALIVSRGRSSSKSFTSKSIRQWKKHWQHGPKT
jgi:uncharacterized integral membrane protein